MALFGYGLFDFIRSQVKCKVVESTSGRVRRDVGKRTIASLRVHGVQNCRQPRMESRQFPERLGASQARHQDPVQGAHHTGMPTRPGQHVHRKIGCRHRMGTYQTR